MNIKYIIREIKNNKSKDADSKDSRSSVYLITYFNGKRFLYSTGQTIKTDLWDLNKGMARKRKGNAGLSTLNTLLERLTTHIQEIERSYKIEGKQLTRELLKKELDIKTGKINNPEVKKEKIKIAKRIKFVDYAEQYILEKKSDGAAYKTLRSTVNMIKENINKNILLDDINADFWKAFKTHMRDKEFAKNYVGKMVGNVVQIMNQALEDKATINNSYKTSKAKRVSEQVYNIYLNNQELEILHNHDFSKQAYKDNACDLFLIGAFTGMRYNDFSDLEGVNFEGGDFVIRDTNKTSSRVIIPQHRIVKEILEKRHGVLPHSITNQKLNKYLKEIGKDVKFNDEIVKTVTRGGKKTRTTYKKYELLCTHTARRSLATNLYLASVPIKSIMLLTGHSTTTHLMSYIKVTELEQAQALKDHPFFK